MSIISLMCSPSLQRLILVALSCLLVVTSASPLVQVQEQQQLSARSSTTDSFCRKFRKECYSLALKGQSGHVEVVQSCQRNGSKTSSSYSFSCKRSSTNLTNKVLNALGQATSVTSTSTTKVRTTVATQTSKTTTTTHPHVTATTVFSVVSTPVVTATSTIVSIESVNVQVFKVTLPTSNSNSRRRSTKQPSTFCSSFASACTLKCSSISSRPKHSVCQADGGPSYTLACVCTNGKHETQHSLLLATEQEDISSATVEKTTSIRVTATATSTIISTKYKSRTITATSTSVTAVAPTSTVTTTTKIILAATGYVHMIWASGDRAGRDEDGPSLYVENGVDRLSLSVSTAEAPDYYSAGIMAVYDETSGLYQMLVNDGTGEVAYILESSSATDTTISEQGSTVAAMYFGNPSDCGSAGEAASGTGLVYGNPCQSYNYAFTPNSNNEYMNLVPTWTNADGSTVQGVLAANPEDWDNFYFGISTTQMGTPLHAAGELQPFTWQFPHAGPNGA